MGGTAVRWRSAVCTESMRLGTTVTSPARWRPQKLARET
jgi:hypothetical protein